MRNTTFVNFTEETAIKMMKTLKEIYEKQLSEEMQFDYPKSIESSHSLKKQRNREMRKEIVTLISDIEDSELLEKVLNLLKDI